MRSNNIGAAHFRLHQRRKSPGHEYTHAILSYQEIECERVESFFPKGDVYAVEEGR